MAENHMAPTQNGLTEDNTALNAAISFNGVVNGNHAAQLLPPKAEFLLSGDSSEKSTSEGATMVTQTDTSDEILSSLETPSEKRGRRASHWIIYVTTFIFSVGFSIVLTSVWPYLQKLDDTTTKVFLGWVIAVNPLGQMLASPLLGLWVNNAGSTRSAFITSTIVFIAGNVLYAILKVFGSYAKAIMVLSRFVVGVSSANIALCRSYIAESTTISERTTAVSATSAAQSLGLILGPAIQTALAVAIPEKDTRHHLQLVNATCSSENQSIASTCADTSEASYLPEWDLYTAAGWVAVILGVVDLFLFLPCIFKEHKIAAKEAELLRLRTRNSNSVYPKPDYGAMIVLLIIFFLFLFLFVLLETIIVPMCMDMYSWTPEYAVTIVGIGFSVVGFLAFIMFIVGGILSKYIDERKVYIFLGLLPLAIGMLILFPMGHNYPEIQKNCFAIDLKNNSESIVASNITTQLPPIKTNATAVLTRVRRAAIPTSHAECGVGCPQSQKWCEYTPIIEIPQLIIGSFAGVVGYPVAFAISSSLYSKLIGPSPQGVWMGILTSTGSFSRMTGPIFVSFVYTNYGPRWTYGTLFFAMVFAVVLAIIMYKRLIPMNIERNATETSPVL